MIVGSIKVFRTSRNANIVDGCTGRTKTTTTVFEVCLNWTQSRRVSSPTVIRPFQNPSAPTLLQTSEKSEIILYLKGAEQGGGTRVLESAYGSKSVIQWPRPAPDRRAAGLRGKSGTRRGLGESVRGGWRHAHDTLGVGIPSTEHCLDLLPQHATQRAVGRRNVAIVGSIKPAGRLHVALRGHVKAMFDERWPRCSKVGERHAAPSALRVCHCLVPVLLHDIQHSAHTARRESRCRCIVE